MDSFGLKKQTMTTNNYIHEKNLPILNALEALGSSKYKEYKEKFLIAEAKKRGFKEGVRFKSALYKYDCVITTYEFDFHFDYMDMCKNVLFCNGNAIFSNGVWAEIVKYKTIKIGGYSVEKIGESYRVGCKRFEITDFIDAKRLIEKAGVKSLRFESIEINIETINKILAL